MTKLYRMAAVMVLVVGVAQGQQGKAAPVERIPQELARSVENGDKVALAQLTTMATNGHSYAQSILGFLYLNGKGVTKDAALGAQWLLKAAGTGAVGTADL